MIHEALDSGIDSGGNPAIREREYRRGFYDAVYETTKAAKCLMSVVSLLSELRRRAGDSYTAREKLHRRKAPYSIQDHCEARYLRGKNHGLSFAIEGLGSIYHAERATSLLSDWCERCSVWAHEKIKDGENSYPPEMGES